MNKSGSLDHQEFIAISNVKAKMTQLQLLLSQSQQRERRLESENTTLRSNLERSEAHRSAAQDASRVLAQEKNRLESVLPEITQTIDQLYRHHKEGEENKAMLDKKTKDLADVTRKLQQMEHREVESLHLVQLQRAKHIELEKKNAQLFQEVSALKTKVQLLLQQNQDTKDSLEAHQQARQQRNCLVADNSVLRHEVETLHIRSVAFKAQHDAEKRNLHRQLNETHQEIECLRRNVNQLKNADLLAQQLSRKLQKYEKLIVPQLKLDNSNLAEQMVGITAAMANLAQ
jgi:hypothetical protein